MKFLRWLNKPSTYVFWVIYLIFVGSMTVNAIENKASGDVPHLASRSDSIGYLVFYFLFLGIFLNILIRAFMVALTWLIGVAATPGKGDQR